MVATTTSDFGAALTSAVQGGYVAQLSGGTYTITQPIVIYVNQTETGPIGIDGGGATLISQVGNGSPLISMARATLRSPPASASSSAGASPWC